MNKKYKVQYSPETDIILISLKNEKPAYGEELSKQVIIHYNKEDKPVEIEILDATEIITNIIKVMMKTRKEEIKVTK